MRRWRTWTPLASSILRTRRCTSSGRRFHMLLGNLAEAEADLLQVLSVSNDDDELAAARRLLAGIR